MNRMPGRFWVCRGGGGHKRANSFSELRGTPKSHPPHLTLLTSFQAVVLSKGASDLSDTCRCILHQESACMFASASQYAQQVA